MTIVSDVQKNWHDGLVEMFELDLQPITGNAVDKFYFTNQIKPNGGKVQWKGRIYEPLPISAAGFERSTSGQIPQPSLTVANVLGTFTQVIGPNNNTFSFTVRRIYDTRG
jgi:lambda family phage minor tail protein L